jgi:hypothetical protein
MTDSAVRRARWLAPALLLLATLGCAAAWILVALAAGRQSSWMAVVAAIDAAVLLRLARAPAGAARAAAGVAATVATIALANWGIAAGEVGRSVGMLPWAAAIRLGPDYAWTLAELANGAADRLWLAAAVVVAAVGSR